MTAERDYQRVDAEADAEHLERRRAALVRAAELSGRHLWIVMTSFLCPDPTSADGMVLDRENLLTYPMIGCYRCEEPYEPRLLHRRCPGEPR